MTYQHTQNDPLSRNFLIFLALNEIYFKSLSR